MSRKKLGSAKRSFAVGFDCKLVSDSFSSEDEVSGVKHRKAKKMAFGKETIPDRYSDSDSDRENINNQKTCHFELEKTILQKFVSEVCNIYNDKYGKLFRQQVLEIENLKRNFTNSLKTEVANWENDMISNKQHEEKLVQMLNQLKDIFTSEAYNQKVKAISDMHTKFLQEYEELLKNHELETMALKSVIDKHVLSIRKRLSQWK